MQRSMVINYSKVSKSFALNILLKVSVNQQKYRFNTEQPHMSSSLNLFQTEWFAHQKNFESMKVEEMNNCLSKFIYQKEEKTAAITRKKKLKSIKVIRSPFAFTSVQQESLNLRHCSV